MFAGCAGALVVMTVLSTMLGWAAPALVRFRLAYCGSVCIDPFVPQAQETVARVQLHDTAPQDGHAAWRRLVHLDAATFLKAYG